MAWYQVSDGSMIPGKTNSTCWSIRFLGWWWWWFVRAKVFFLTFPKMGNLWKKKCLRFNLNKIHLNRTPLGILALLISKASVPSPPERGLKEPTKTPNLIICILLSTRFNTNTKAQWGIEMKWNEMQWKRHSLEIK